LNYDPEAAGRVRQVLSSRDGVAEKRLVGGLSFLVNGNMTPQTRASVTRIRAVHCRYAARPGHDPRTLYPVSGSGVLSDLESADGWTRDCGDVQFAGYLVDLDSEETSARRT
jgi:Family of unknown function (DUF6578)